MADVLSQSEVESLLAALHPRGTPAVTPSEKNGGRISADGFPPPEFQSKELLRALQVLHEGFCRGFGAALCDLLRSSVALRLIGVDRLTYGEFVAGLANPTCFNLLESDGLDGHLVLDMNPSIIFPMVDRLLGGACEPQFSLPNRALTPIELRLVARVTTLAIAELEKVWSALCDLKLRMREVESDPQRVPIVPPAEEIVLVRFEAALGESRGMMHLCIPFAIIEPLAEKLSADPLATTRLVDPGPERSLRTGSPATRVELTVQLAATTLTAGDILNLAVGDVIVTENGQEHGLQVLIEGRPMFLGRPGLYQGHKAIEIRRTLVKPKDLIK
jgi:flagellar motor switch protein FliM